MDYITLLIYEGTLTIMELEGIKMSNIQAFQDNFLLIVKCVDLTLMLIGIQFIRKKPNPLIILCLSVIRIALQVMICRQLRESSFVVILNLNLIFNTYAKQLHNEHLRVIGQFAILGMAYLDIDSKDSIAMVAIALSTLSAMNSLRIQKPQPQHKDTPDFDHCIPKFPQKDDEQSKLSVRESPIQKESSKSIEAHILDDYAWIKGQQFIVIDEYETILMQTFNVANFNNFSRSSMSQSLELDSLQSILQLSILGGNKDFQDMILTSQYIESNKFTLKDLIIKASNDYELYKNSLFIITSVDQKWMEGWMIKVFLINKQRRVLIFIQLEQKEVNKNPSLMAAQIFTHSLCGSLNAIMTLSALSEYDKIVSETVLEKYFYPIRIASVQIYLQLANLRDYNLHHQKKLLLKAHSIQIQNTLEDLALFFQDSARAKGNEIKIDVEEVDLIDSDSERIKQMTYPLLKFLIRETKDDQIYIRFRVLGLRSYSLSLSTQKQLDDREIRKLKLDLKRAYLQYSEISVSQLLAIYFSGSMKKGIDIENGDGGTIITIYMTVPDIQSDEVRNLKLVGQSHYFETSLSQMLAHNVTDSRQVELTNTILKEGTQRFSQDYSLHFSQSRISKQFSQKYSEYQSNYLSQVSKMKGRDVPSFENACDDDLNQQPSFSNNNVNNNTNNNNNTKYQLPHFPDEQLRPREQTFLNQPIENKISTSVIDFGSDLNVDTIHLPVSAQFKLQDQIIKFSVYGDCCSRVLLADSEFQNIQILEIMLSFYKIKTLRAFSTEEVLKYINNKTTCKCGNSGFVLYFINVDLPKKSGLWLCRTLRERMSSDLQKGYIIATTGLVDYYNKLELYRNGIDQYISLPYDLIEVNQILKFLRCN